MRGLQKIRRDRGVSQKPVGPREGESVGRELLSSVGQMLVEVEEGHDKMYQK